jgi:phosphatidylglycerophosphatase A
MSETPSVKAPRWAWWIATGFGSGWIRPAPGTWGSLAGLLAWCLLLALGPMPFVNWCSLHTQHPHLLLYRHLMEIPFLLAIGGLTWLGVRASERVVRETGLKDPGYIVVDEWVGMWLALWPMRWDIVLVAGQAFSRTGQLRLMMLLGIPFLLFRILDIWKPWPVNPLQDLPEGQGVVADDLVAGLYCIPLVLILVPAALAWVR